MNRGRMHQEGHYGAALLLYAPLGAVVLLAGAPTLAVGGGIMSLALAMLPDWDMRLPAIEHRGVTHTVWFALIMGVFVSSVGVYIGSQRGGTLTIVAVGLFGLGVGFMTILSHILADALTPMGVTPFASLNGRHVSFDLVRSKNQVANYGLLTLGGLAAGAVLLLLGQG